MTDKALTMDDLDQLGQAVISLTRELWVLKDRQLILEAALAEAGVLEREAVESYVPDEALREKLSSERRRLLDNVLGALTGQQQNASSL